jgi:hypothetical protein
MTSKATKTALKRAVVHPVHREHITRFWLFSIMEMALALACSRLVLEIIMILGLATGESLTIMVAIGMITIEDEDDIMPVSQEALEDEERYSA